MKHYFKTATAILIAASVFTACKRDALESITEQQTGPYASLQDFYNHNGAQAQTFNFNTNQDFILTGSMNTSVFIPANSLTDSAGNHPAGNVTATLKEIYNIKDMILSKVSTTSNGSLLQSGGMFYLTFTSGTVNYYSGISMSVSLPQVPTDSSPFMNVFYGTLNDTTGVYWVVADSSYFTMNPAPNPTSYYFGAIDSLGYGWINCDKFYNTTPLTDLSINAEVTGERGESVALESWLAFPSINSCMNVYDVLQASAIAHNIPVGMQAVAVVIGVGRVTKKPYFGITSFTVTAGQPVHVSVVQTDDAHIISTLQSL